MVNIQQSFSRSSNFGTRSVPRSLPKKGTRSVLCSNFEKKERAYAFRSLFLMKTESMFCQEKIRIFQALSLITRAEMEVKCCPLTPVERNCF